MFYRVVLAPDLIFLSGHFNTRSIGPIAVVVDNTGFASHRAKSSCGLTSPFQVTEVGVTKKRKIMKYNLLTALLLTAIAVALAPSAFATTWYVNGVTGNDSNNCMSPTTACKTIGHAISLAASGDTVRVAATTYIETIVIGFNLRILGSGATSTIIDAD